MSEQTMESKVIKFNADLYPKEAVLKAAYHFIDSCYLHIDVINNEFIIEIIKKSKSKDDITEYEFENELLAQTVRYYVYNQTHTIREILMARAMASTIIGSNTEYENTRCFENSDNLENILKDWFKKNEE